MQKNIGFDVCACFFNHIEKKDSIWCRCCWSKWRRFDVDTTLFGHQQLCLHPRHADEPWAKRTSLLLYLHYYLIDHSKLNQITIVMFLFGTHIIWWVSTRCQQEEFLTLFIFYRKKGNNRKLINKILRY